MNHTAALTLLLSALAVSGLAQADHHGGDHGHAMQGDRMPPMFMQFDKNQDGRVSREEAREGADRMFTEIDTDKDGFISKEEMQAHHQAMRDKVRQGMREHMKAADKDGDGALSRAEVEAAKLPRLARDFDKLDRNKDGKLTPDEMRGAMMPERAPRP